MPLLFLIYCLTFILLLANTVGISQYYFIRLFKQSILLLDLSAVVLHQLASRGTWLGRGFGFLKDPLFFTDSVFIKSPERVEAMAMLMRLCLLLYTLAQRQLRQALKLAHSGIKNQYFEVRNVGTIND